MENKTNSKGYPASCMNCSKWGNKVKIANNKIPNTTLYGVCYEDKNKLEFIYNKENSCCIMTPSTAICKHFDWRVE